VRELEARAALVTGGGSGLGKAICRALASAGARVAVADIRLDAARSVADELQSGDCEAMAIELDVTDEGQANRSIRDAAERFGRLDYLVNSAGVDVTVPIEGLSAEQFDRVVAVNLRGPFLMSKAAIPVMKERGSGHIVNIASTASRRAWPNASAYHASKWGLLGFSHALWTEVREHGIKATAVIAGGMRTPFLLDRFPELDQDTLQDPANVADTVRYVLSQPAETVIPEVMVIPVRESSWP
jgi:NAD(P)-dependent dehydrogenase (short-subunit alcohol dehydrogenase family)